MACDMRFDQCLQWFREIKKPRPGRCTDLASSAKIAQ
jgi:hypothetical protein